MTYQQTTGKFGEEMAVKYLIKKGYKIIARNVKTSCQEIDIIASIKQKYIFIEVKTRVIYNDEPYEEVLTKNKIRNIKKAIFFYFNSINYQPLYFRADLLVVEINKVYKKANIKYYKEIF